MTGKSQALDPGNGFTFLLPLHTHTHTQTHTGKKCFIAWPWWKAHTHPLQPAEPVWTGVFEAGWVSSSVQNPSENLCQDESLLFPEALKEMELANLDRGICRERHIKGQWAITAPLPCSPSPHPLLSTPVDSKSLYSPMRTQCRCLYLLSSHRL